MRQRGGGMRKEGGATACVEEGGMGSRTKKEERRADETVDVWSYDVASRCRPSQRRAAKQIRASKDATKGPVGMSHRNDR